MGRSGLGGGFVRVCVFFARFIITGIRRHLFDDITSQQIVWNGIEPAATFLIIDVEYIRAISSCPEIVLAALGAQRGIRYLLCHLLEQWDHDIPQLTFTLHVTLKLRRLKIV